MSTLVVKKGFLFASVRFVQKDSLLLSTFTLWKGLGLESIDVLTYSPTTDDFG